jgi:hypothetical protein
MAGDWMKFEKTTLEKPEVFEMAGILEIDADAVIGKLLRVWNWFDDQSRDGHAHVTVMSLLDRYTGVTGFVDAMVKVGWMHIEGSSLSLPNFDRHNGDPAKVRALARTRKQNERVRHGESVTKSGQSCDNPVTREEKRIEEKKVEDKQTHADAPAVKAKASGPEEVEAFAVSLGCPAGQGAAAFWKWEGNGWTNGKAPIKDWRATVRSWKAQGYAPFISETAPAGKPVQISFALQDKERKEAERHGPEVIVPKIYYQHKPQS